MTVDEKARDAFEAVRAAIAYIAGFDSDNVADYHVRDVIDAVLAYEAAKPAPTNGGSIKMPETADEAEAMEKLSFAWLKENAPERLTPEGLARPVPAPSAAGASEVVAEVVWYDPRLDVNAMKPRRIIDGTAKFIGYAPLGAKLYASPVEPKAPAPVGVVGGEDAVREALERAFRWFRKYPEYKPNPDMMDHWLADIAAANAALASAATAPDAAETRHER